jgi:hypothetical protein
VAIQGGSRGRQKVSLSRVVGEIWIGWRIGARKMSFGISWNTGAWKRRCGGRGKKEAEDMWMKREEREAVGTRATRELVVHAYRSV